MKKSIAGIALMLAIAGQAFGQTTGPSSSVNPMITGTYSNVETVSILTVGDTPTGSNYRMVGIPDGLGAFDNGNGTYTLLMNHELGDTLGVVRAHGSVGAFVSKWVIDASTHEVLSGEDLCTTVYQYDVNTGAYVAGTTAFSRFCSGDLPAPTAFYNSATGMGTQERIYMNGEETGSEGRAVGFIATGPDAGDAYVLAWLGRMSWENSIASPTESDATVVIGTDDAFPGELFVYVGTKTNTGTDIDKAGLNNGKLYGIKVTGYPDEPVAGIPNGTPFTLYEYTSVLTSTGADLQTQSTANGVTGFARPEDGAFNPLDGNEFIWASTGNSGRPTRLWKLTFNDITDPTLGGTIDTLIEGDATGLPFDMDNLTVDAYGNVLIQEDTGSSDRLAKIWNYSLNRDALTEIAEHSPEFFDPNLLGAGMPGPNFITTNEEASGIIPMFDILGNGWYVLDVQVHASNPDPELVEGGQLVAMKSPFAFCYGDFDQNTMLNIFDYIAYGNAYANNDALADCTGDGTLNIFDYICFGNQYALGCPNN
ncbi:MAG: DUF839 domain-containing protein [Phycisphaeraceae bacterium]|nr:DUF839 domain-containing protein [Phycisphaerales bacterium]MCB9859621.1 DUF839 domain-containing protein [Phycisphaeraceae bacterium]